MAWQLRISMVVHHFILYLTSRKWKLGRDPFFSFQHLLLWANIKKSKKGKKDKILLIALKKGFLYLLIFDEDATSQLEWKMSKVLNKKFYLSSAIITVASEREDSEGDDSRSRIKWARQSIVKCK